VRAGSVLTRTYRRRSGGCCPTLRLGCAVHRVLGWVSPVGCSEPGSSELDVAVQQRWRDEVTVEEQAVARSFVENYVSPASSWLEHATTEERLVIGAGWLAAELYDLPDTERWVEQPLTASILALRGSPDLAQLSDDDARIVAFKSGVDAYSLGTVSEGRRPRGWHGHEQACSNARRPCWPVRAGLALGRARDWQLIGVRTWGLPWTSRR